MQEGLSTQREEPPIPKANNGVPQTDWDQTNKKNLTLNYQVGLIYRLTHSNCWVRLIYLYLTVYLWVQQDQTGFDYKSEKSTGVQQEGRLGAVTVSQPSHSTESWKDEEGDSKSTQSLDTSSVQHNPMGMLRLGHI